jgi:hypothetical protein
MKTIKDLVAGESMFSSIKKVAGGKYQLELAEVIQNPGQSVNVAFLLNKSDKRFEQSAPKARRAWITGEAADILSNFNIDVKALTFDKEGVCALSTMNPQLGGYQMRIRIVDTFGLLNREKKAVESGAVTADRYYKKTATGEVFVKDNQIIYTRTEIYAGSSKEVPHLIIKSDARVSVGQLSSAPVATSEKTLN